MLDFIVLFLTVGIPLSSALLLASLGETVNQRSGVFNLGCEGVMSMGAFVGMLIPFMVGGSGKDEGDLFHRSVLFDWLFIWDILPGSAGRTSLKGWLLHNCRNLEHWNSAVSVVVSDCSVRKNTYRVP